MKLNLAICVASLVASHAMAQTPDPFMGDWSGSLKLNGADTQNVAVYMIPLSGGNYEMKVVSEFNKRVPTLFHLKGQLQDGKFMMVDNIPFDTGHVVRSVDDGVVVNATLWAGAVKDGALTGKISGTKHGEFTLKQSQRLSPTLGKAAPAGAVVILDGKNLDAWQPRDPNAGSVKWKLVDGGAMEVNGGDIMTKEQFGDHKLHLEFRTPYMPTSFGQGRGNSGVYLQGRYEVQVLDSYGLEGEDNECGGIYQVSKPAANMAAPPLQWQSYDMTFRAPRFDANGQKTANARVTIVHNGVTIHNDLELPRTTGGAIDAKESATGPLLLQDHGNPVQYRNIWIEKIH